MDLGIKGRRAIVCGGSAGLGRAIASALSHEGAEVLIAARTEDRVRNTAAEISQSSGNVVDYLVADVTTQEGRDALLARCANPDILVNNAGGPPVGNFRDLTRDDWIKALDANMLSAVDLINSTLDSMIEAKFGRIVNITSHMVKAPVALLSLSNGARAGLTAYTAGIAREVAAHNITINNLLPGQFDTDRLKSNHEKFAATQSLEVSEARNRFMQAIPAGRFGEPKEFGAYAAFLCSDLAGFVTGQNLMLDGGQYPGVF
jgi:3-oxoacyl-[acyl-carrier protein] reductase